MMKPLLPSSTSAERDETAAVDRALMARDILESRDDIAEIGAKIDKLTVDVETLMHLLHSANAIGKLLTWIAGASGAIAAFWAWMLPHMQHGPLK